MINILALETTGKYGSAAVIKEDGSVYCASSETEMNHLKDIITISDEAVKAAGITKKELTHVAASAGPGSFTGIRIGVTTARTLGQMLGIPCIAVSSLEAMARRVLSEAIAAEALYVVPVINARRHQTYAGAWQAVFTSDGEKQSIVSEIPEKQYMIEDLLEALSAKAVHIILIHNHPSGDPSPSPQDIDVTKRLIKASEILGIRLIDHVIVGNGCFTSMKSEGYFGN